MIESHFEGFEGSETVGAPGSHSHLVELRYVDSPSGLEPRHLPAPHLVHGGHPTVKWFPEPIPTGRNVPKVCEPD